MKRIAPQAGWIVGKERTKRETQTAAGLWVPEKADSQDEVVVIATGPEVKRCKVGDVVIFVQGRTSNKTGEQVWLIQDEHIIATVVDG